MKIIGICGTSGSGKSTICNYFQSKGHKVCDCDRLYSEIITPPSKCLDEIENCFGSSVICSDGKLNRKALAEIIFSSAEKREALNAITFSHIKKELFVMIENAKDEEFFFIDAPLLFESGIDKMCYKTLCVVAPREKKIERLCERDGLGKDFVSKRLNAQIKDEELIKLCDLVIVNDSDIKTLYNKADEILRSL